MKRLSQLLGLPVVNSADGRTIGHLLGLRVRGDGRTIEGLRVKGEGFGQKRLVVPIEQTILMGDVSVIVEGRGLPEKQGGLAPRPGQRVVSTAGTRIGLLTNLLVDEGASVVKALEVSRGALDDWQTGRIWVNSFRISDGEVVVSPGQTFGEEEGE